VGNIVVDGTGSLHLKSTGDIANLEFKSADTKITIEPGTKIGNVKLPEGVKVQDVIENYEEVKEQVGQIGGKPNTDVPGTPPSPSPGGGGGSGGGGSPGTGDDQSAVTAITVDPKELTLTVGDTGQIRATVLPKEVTNKKVTW